MFLLALLAGCGKPATAAPAPLGMPTPAYTPTPLVVAGMPADVPLMPRAYDVQILRADVLVVYRVQAPLQEVLAYYRETLPQYGWRQEGAEITAMGNVANIALNKPNGARVLLSLRYDAAGKFVTVAISVARP